MNTKNKLSKSDQKITEQIYNRIKSADAIVIGAGAGLSASAGLDYNDEKIFEKYYYNFFKKGYRKISDGISANWYLDENIATTYWGFWANHINNIFYVQPQLQTYKLLYNIVKDKSHYIITTNADGQFYKGDFKTDKIFAMQGSYGQFQCQKKCHDTVYNNEEMIKQMLDGFDANNLEIQHVDIPRCHKCGDLLAPNLRIDSRFVEKPNMINQDKYITFINDNANKSLVFLELGVGYNTPAIIRFPFEQMTQEINNSYLIRVNKIHPSISNSISERGTGTSLDIHELLTAII